MSLPRRFSHRPLYVEAQVRPQDVALNSVTDSGPLGVSGALSHHPLLVTVQTHTSPKRYQSFGHMQHKCRCTPVRLVTRLTSVLLGHSKAADVLAGRSEESGKKPSAVTTWVARLNGSRLHSKCNGTRAETGFRLSAKRTSPFKSAGASVQLTTGSRGVRISGSNARYTMFRGSVKSTGYPLHSSVSPSLPFPCVTVCYHFSTRLYTHEPCHAKKTAGSVQKKNAINITQETFLKPQSVELFADPTNNTASEFL
jgi:hypothetical protein